MNPVAVTQFFHHICVGLFDALLSLVWLAGNLEFFTLRDRLQTETVFAGRMIRYISSVIKCAIDVFTRGLDDAPAPTQTPSASTFRARDPENDSAFGSRLRRDATAVASRDVHSETHNPTCFKYAKARLDREIARLLPHCSVLSVS
jgi:hypothetical protein